MDEMIILAFLLGAFVAKMYYRSKLKGVEAERDAWEHKAKSAQKKNYADLFNSATNQMGNYEHN
jgi:hypothetical protein